MWLRPEHGSHGCTLQVMLTSPCETFVCFFFFLGIHNNKCFLAYFSYKVNREGLTLYPELSQRMVVGFQKMPTILQNVS